MTPNPPTLHQWPALPPLPPAGDVVLVRITTPPSRPAARPVLRDALASVLAAWSGLAPECLPWVEGPQGPVWLGALAGEPLALSLAYSDQAGWIGLRRGGGIGIDALTLHPIPEAEAVGHHFLGTAALAQIQDSPEPALAFATAWTQLESRIKCLKLPLGEGIEDPRLRGPRLTTQTLLVDQSEVVSISLTELGETRDPRGNGHDPDSPGGNQSSVPYP